MTSKIEEMLRELPPDLHQEVEDFVQFLIENRGKKPARKLRLDWEGGLSDLADQYTALELQKKALHWRDDP
jgi:hypothetical protein